MHGGNSSFAKITALAFLVEAWCKECFGKPNSCRELIREKAFTVNIHTVSSFVQMHRDPCQERGRASISHDGKLEQVGGGQASGVNGVNTMLVCCRDEETIGFVVEGGAKGEQHWTGNTLEEG